MYEVYENGLYYDKIKAMLGYVTCENAELKMKDFELYGGYYCGVCKSIGKRYGHVPRMVLSYDAAFLALVLAGLLPDKNQISREHCIIHHIKKKTVVRNKQIDYAADVMLILAWYKLEDDARDENKIPAKATMKIMKRLFRKLEKARPNLCMEIKKGLFELEICEANKVASIDEPGEAFGKIMAAVLTGYVRDAQNEGQEILAKNTRLLERIGMHLGKWIYLMDAWEDIEDNLESGAYNPLLYRFKYTENSQENFRETIHNDVERNLMIYLAELAKTFDLLDIRKNKDIIENIVYMGLLRRTEKALGKDEKENGKSI